MSEFPWFAFVLWPPALVLMMWRWPNGDKLHRPAAFVAAIVWMLLALLEPTLRNPYYALGCVFFLGSALSRRRNEAVLTSGKS